MNGEVKDRVTFNLYFQLVYATDNRVEISPLNSYELQPNLKEVFFLNFWLGITNQILNIAQQEDRI